MLTSQNFNWNFLWLDFQCGKAWYSENSRLLAFLVNFNNCEIYITFFHLSLLCWTWAMAESLQYRVNLFAISFSLCKLVPLVVYKFKTCFVLISFITHSSNVCYNWLKSKQGAKTTNMEWQQPNDWHFSLVFVATYFSAAFFLEFLLQMHLQSHTKQWLCVRQLTCEYVNR